MDQHRYVIAVAVLCQCLNMIAVHLYSQQTNYASSTETEDEMPAVNNINHRFIHNPIQKCSSSTKLLQVIIVVISVARNSERRMTIRKTWGSKVLQDDSGLAFVFILGKPFINSQQRSIDEESQTFQDIVQLDFLDSYRNMSLKSSSALKWVTLFCSNAQYMFKTDDDVFVNTDHLKIFFMRHNPSRMIMGLVVKEGRPNRDPTSKWFLSKKEYPDDTYPMYVSGGGYAVSKDVIPQLYQIARHTSRIPFEDVYITGLCARKLSRVQFVYNNAIRTQIGIVPFSCQYYKHGISYHRVPPTLMQEIWSKLPSCWTL